MSYLLVENFKDGLDARKMVLTTKAGALLTANNIHITRGGEIEKSKAWVPYLTLPAGATVGLQSASGNLYTFGQTTTPAMPPGITYQRVRHPSSISLQKVLYTENYQGKIYNISLFNDGSIYHYYDGNRVTRWDTLASTAFSVNTVATSLAQLIDQETPFTCTSLNAVLTITEVNNNVPFTVTTLATNGGLIADETMLEADIQIATGGQPQISTVTIGGTVEALDKYQITISIPSTGYNKNFTVTGQASTMPKVVKTFNSKMYALSASLLHFCEIGSPMNWGVDPTTGVYINGAGVIDMSSQDAGSETLTGLGVYQGKLAVFSPRTIQIWTMDADPTKNGITQILTNIGTSAPRSVVSFGDVDIFFKADTGIRSIRARDASNAATVSDVGTNVDPIFLANNQALTALVQNDAVGIIEPVDGRYMLAIDTNVYVYSYFPTPGVSAWSMYQPGFVISHLVYCNGRVYARSGDTIYIYGGLDNQTYDSSQIIADLPYLDISKPATTKRFGGFDIALEGTVDVYIGTDPNFPNNREFLGTYSRSSYGLTNIIWQNLGTHIGVRIVSKYAGYIRIGNVSLHHNLADSG